MRGVWLLRVHRDDVFGRLNGGFHEQSSDRAIGLEQREHDWFMCKQVLANLLFVIVISLVKTVNGLGL